MEIRRSGLGWGLGHLKFFSAPEIVDKERIQIKLKYVLDIFFYCFQSLMNALQEVNKPLQGRSVINIKIKIQKVIVHTFNTN
jgi:hypothetical protein